MTRFLVGQALLLLAVLLGITLIGGRLVTWLHPAVMAALFVVAVPLLATLSAFPFRAVRQALADALHPEGDTPTKATSLRIWHLLEYSVVAGGLLAFCTGLIITFTFLDTANPFLGFKLAATLVAPFYSVLLTMACRVLRTKVEGDADPH